VRDAPGDPHLRASAPLPAPVAGMSDDARRGFARQRETSWPVGSSKGSASLQTLLTMAEEYHKEFKTPATLRDGTPNPAQAARADTFKKIIRELEAAIAHEATDVVNSSQQDSAGAATVTL